MIKFLIFCVIISGFSISSRANIQANEPQEINNPDTIRTYKVIEGDWLSKIAMRQEYYNDPEKWIVIYNSNKDIIKDPDLLFPGQLLKIPHLKNTFERVRIDTPIKDSALVQKKIKTEDIEFQGFIVDETQSKWGKDFYEFFYNQLITKPNLTNFTIVISEKAMPRLGSQISIKVSDNEIFQQFIQPKQENIEEMAQYGVELTMNYIQNYEEIEKSLQSNDMKGTGIF